MMSTPVYDDFKHELTRSEWQRARLMVASFVAGTIIVVINYFFLSDEITSYYGGPANYWFIVGWLVLFTAFEAMILWLVRVKMKKRERLSDWFKMAYTAIEVSLPSALVLYMIVVQGMLVFLDSPVTLLYFLFIVLSILHLDFKVNLLAGLLSAIQYGALVYYAYHFAEANMYGYPNVPENNLYLRCVVIVIAGVAAAMVSQEVKSRVRSSLESQREKGELEEMFGQQVSAPVLQTLIRGRDQMQRTQATVLALDVRNFTSFAGTRTPDEILSYQNKLFGPVLEIISQHQGIVNQIMGDGLMATFGTPVENPLHAEMAFQAAIQIRERVHRLGALGEIPSTRLGIGLHTGEVVFGNIGNERRKQFSISGAAVIIAFRVEQLNKELNTEILLTAETREQITVGRRDLVTRGPQSLKGIDRTIDVYEVI